MTPAPELRAQVTATDTGALLARFGAALRRAGLDAGPDRLVVLGRALALVDLTRRAAVHAAGLAVVCTGAEDRERYDRAFAELFDGARAAPRRPGMSVVGVDRPVAVRDAAAAGGSTDDTGDAARAATTSAAEVLRHRDVARLTAAERAEVRRLLALLAPAGPQRRSRRTSPAAHGRVDLRRTARASVARGGEPLLRHRRRRLRPRRLVLLLDVSGSMAPYADALLRFAHAAARRRPGTEVFTLGTQLTRVTGAVTLPDADEALAAVSAAVPDWSGGTRLGDTLTAFLDRWGQRGVARGAVVLVASDGWERGDTRPLADAMARLHRLAYRVVWVNPHKARPGFAPATAGLAAALPHVDAFVEGHSLAAYEQLVVTLGSGRA